MRRASKISNVILFSSSLTMGTAAFAAGHIDNSSSEMLIAQSEQCGAILQEAVDLAAGAVDGEKLTAEESNARAGVRKRLSDCSESYLNSVDDVLVKFINNKP